ncbi:MAG: ATP-binding protein [Deltaproteobacteria bacterium]|uniref:ATP-binding protein n=1 Tax=Desulfobacula sp. TaxID=2593537 RepID=UPI0019B7543D|nr:ATP-binding protein [Candidatus Desulfobacula maris]MBL6994470.1 ATP-binding protein [Desulfobacula sp.]
MKRKINSVLNQWKTSPLRQPLLVRGARQVGKTYSVSAFGDSNFENMVSVNFEEQPELADCFSEYDTKAIIDRLSIFTKSVIQPGQTLLFLDEIQECPRAITSLRYFYEKIPELHVIGAGSLIEFALRSKDFRMPVGRIQSVFMFPLSFEEFLNALGEEKLCGHMKTLNPEKQLEKIFKDRLENLIRTYLLTGGMPASVKAYSSKIPMEEIQRQQQGLIRTYSADFSKYASTAKHKYLRQVYDSAPRMVGQRYKYSHVNPDIESKFLKDALNLLCEARCLTKICHSSGAGLPMAADLNEKKFKVACLDVGLMQNALGIQSSIALNVPVMTINAGGVAEQFTAQELLAAGDPYAEPGLFFWARDARGSNAEVDYLIHIQGKIFPVEVKAGTTGSLKSMKLFLEKYPDTPFGIRYSMHELSFHDRILSIPLYMIWNTEYLIQNLLE